MVNFSLDDGDTTVMQPPARRRRPSLAAGNRSGAPSPRPRQSKDGRVKKIINGEVVYVRIRRVVRT